MYRSTFKLSDTLSDTCIASCIARAIHVSLDVSKITERYMYRSTFNFMNESSGKRYMYRFACASMDPTCNTTDTCDGALVKNTLITHLKYRLLTLWILNDSNDLFFPFYSTS